MLFSEHMSIIQEPDLTKIVTVGVVSGGYILCGKRRDNGKWTHPGGHMDKGEDILTAAQREVKEETGIDVDWQQLEFIGAEKFAKGRGGFPFAVIAFLAHVDRQKTTTKNDPDKEFSELKWVEIDKSSPELLVENRHAREDCILIYLGVNTRKPEAKLRRMADISDDLQNAGFDKNPEDQVKSKQAKKPGEEEEKPAPPEPGPKTPADMANSPDAYLPEEEVVGD